MLQRRAITLGRPSGTDGSDFSYRMVVDSRYTKVAKGKVRLQLLIVFQAIFQIVGALLTAASASNSKGLDNFTILSTGIGFISLLLGELGRRRSLTTLLILYATISSVATALSVAHIVQGNFHFEAIQNWNISSLDTFELVEAGLMLIGVMLQILVVITTVRLLQNMSPKRGS